MPKSGVTKSNFSFSEVLGLIDFCRKKGVLSLECGTLRVVFAEQTKRAITPSVRQTKAAAIKTENVEKDSLRAASKALDESEIEMMSLEDPALLEQLLIEGELELDGSSSSESRTETA